MYVERGRCWPLPSSSANKTVCTSWDLEPFSEVIHLSHGLSLTSPASVFQTTCLSISDRFCVPFSSHLTSPFPPLCPLTLQISARAFLTPPAESALFPPASYALLRFFHGTYRYVFMYDYLVLIPECLPPYKLQEAADIYLTHFCIEFLRWNLAPSRHSIKMCWVNVLN